MVKTKIEWCDSSWSPVSGCYHGCSYCYARGIAHRFKGCDDAPDGKAPDRIVDLAERKKYTDKRGRKINAAYPYGFTPTMHRYRLEEPHTKGFGETIFVCSTADLFGDWVPDEWIESVFEACSKAENHRYLFLTKNPKRYEKLEAAGKLPGGEQYWYGTTVTTPDQPMFCSEKRKTFVSIEPILAPFNGCREMFSNTDWIILGAETGNRKDKVIPEKNWIEEMVMDLERDGKPIFMKDSMKSVWGKDIITEFPWY